jgi:hypothetical protein
MAEKSQMLSDLKAYVSTAMHALLENHTGVPAAYGGDQTK